MINEVGEMDSVSPDDHNNSGISVFEIDSPDYKLNFLSWILDITQEEAGLRQVLFAKRVPVK